MQAASVGEGDACQRDLSPKVKMPYTDFDQRESDPASS